MALTPEERKAREAAQAREKRAKARALNPVKTARVFTCRSCTREWETEEKGNFWTCPTCREGDKDKARVAVVASRTKTCAYASCSKVFADTSPQNSSVYCNAECRRRSKLERSGEAPVEGFLADRVYVCQNDKCKKEFTPGVTTQKFCSIGCRSVVYAGGDESRTKVCVHCQKPFVDPSPKNNQRSHPACSRKVWDHKPHPDRPLDKSVRLSVRRRNRVRLGDGGRLDDIGTMRKYTQSWWGRVSELIFAAYRPEASDVNESNGGRSPYDFDDPELGKVDVRSTQERPSPEGRAMWSFQVDGLKESCDHAFLLGYARGGERVAHMWIIPKADINDTLVRMAPGSSEYSRGRWDVTPEWGTMVGDRTLKRVRGMPDPVKPVRRFSWVGLESNFMGTSTVHRGRRGEFLYKARHPTSVDVNERDGMLAHHDFEDADRTRVNVKTSRRHPRNDRKGMLKWSFSLLAVHQVAAGHQCDVYSCLCLDESGNTVLKELRIPVSVLGARRLIHVYDRPDDQWQEYVSG